MKLLQRFAVAAVAAGLVGTAPVEAQLTPSAPPVCSAWSYGWTDCSGAWYGNDDNQQADVLAEISGQGWLTNAYQATSVDVEAGPMGTISFGPGHTEFVLALKASNEFSLYYFAGSFDAIDYNTIGSGLNRHGRAQGLSHWSLYVGDETVVPEPGSLALLGTGLLGLALVRRREDDD